MRNWKQKSKTFVSMCGFWGFKCNRVRELEKEKWSSWTSQVMRVEKVNMFFFSFGVFTHFSRESESHLKPSFNHLRHECKSWSNQLYLDIRLLSVLLLLHYSAWIAWGCPIREVLSSLAIQIQLFLSGLVKINTHTALLWSSGECAVQDPYH